MKSRCIARRLTRAVVLVSSIVVGGLTGTAHAAATVDQQLLDAAENGYPALVQTLLEKGGDVNARDQSGATPLMIAADQGNLDIVRLLLEKGADVNAKDGQDSSALIEASKRGFLEIVKLLLERGANVSATDNKRKTAAMYAQERGHSKVANVLEAHRSAPIVGSAPPATSKDTSATSEGIIDLNLLHTWGLLYKIDENGHEERPIEGTRTLIEFTDKGQLIFSKVDNGSSHQMKNRAGKYALNGNEISITDESGNTMQWVYQVSGDTLVIDMPDAKNKFYWGRFR